MQSGLKLLQEGYFSKKNGKQKVIIIIDSKEQSIFWKCACYFREFDITKTCKMLIEKFY